MNRLCLKIITLLIFFCSCKNNNSKSQPKVIECSTLDSFIKKATGNKFGGLYGQCTFDSTEKVYRVFYSGRLGDGFSTGLLYYGTYKYNPVTKNIFKEIMLHDSDGTFIDSNIVYNKQKYHL